MMPSLLFFTANLNAEDNALGTGLVNSGCAAGSDRPAARVAACVVCARNNAEGIAAAGEGCIATIEMPSVHPLIAPLVYAVPVQLLAYHTACVKGTDVDQPRNLAKSVTVE